MEILREKSLGHQERQEILGRDSGQTSGGRTQYLQSGVHPLDGDEAGLRVGGQTHRVLQNSGQLRRERQRQSGVRRWHVTVQRHHQSSRDAHAAS